MLLSEAFFRKYGLDREIKKLKAKGIDLSKLAELMVAYKLATTSASSRRMNSSWSRSSGNVSDLMSSM